MKTYVTKIYFALALIAIVFCANAVEASVKIQSDVRANSNSGENLGREIQNGDVKSTSKIEVNANSENGTNNFSIEVQLGDEAEKLSSEGEEDRSGHLKLESEQGAAEANVRVVADQSQSEENANKNESFSPCIAFIEFVKKIFEAI